MDYFVHSYLHYYHTYLPVVNSKKTSGFETINSSRTSTECSLVTKATIHFIHGCTYGLIIALYLNESVNHVVGWGSRADHLL